MHTKAGKSERPNNDFLLNAWKETDLYGEEEKEVPAIRKKDLINQFGITDIIYQQVKKLFDIDYWHKS